MTITIYTKPNCMQCEQTKKFLDRSNVSYKTVDISQDSEAYSLVTEMGFQSAPVVVTDIDKWAGFKVEKLNQTIEAYKQTA